MKKIGVCVVNVLFASWIIFTIYTVLASIWLSAGLIIISPILVIGASVIGLQSFFFINFVLGLALSALTIILLPVLIRATRMIQFGVSAYFSQMRMIWHS